MSSGHGSCVTCQVAWHGGCYLTGGVALVLTGGHVIVMADCINDNMAGVCARL